MTDFMMNAKVYDRADQLPADFISSCKNMPYPRTLLMCPPDNFDVIDVKNPHMEGNIGNVDRSKARAQWDEVREAFLSCNADVELIEPVSGCEDMVFCANQTLVGLNSSGQKLCLLSQMKYESRQREVSAFGKWFASHGYDVKEIPHKIGFEGSGDAIWHPGKALIWGGSGFRSQPEVYPFVSEYFGVPVIRLPLRSERFYHLDTCFAAIDDKTVLVHPNSLSPERMEIIRHLFKNVVECDDTEANDGMACNATAIGGRHVVIQKGNNDSIKKLRALGYEVHEVDTGEYMKSGGSVFCMKMYVF